MPLPKLGSGKNKYLCTYKGKKVEVLADTQLEARDLAAKHFQARKPYEVEAYLLELAGKPYAQTTMFASDRSSLIRLASSLPAGDETRKAILAGLQKTSAEKPLENLRRKASGNAKEIAAEILKVFSADNDYPPGTRFPVVEVERAVAKMLAGGAVFDAEGIELIAAGDYDDREARYGQYEGYVEIDEILNSLM